MAAVLLAVPAAVAFVSELASLSAGKLPLHGVPLVEAVLAAASASRNSGLLVCWVLALAPVVGPLAVYREFRHVRRSGPVALPLSFRVSGQPSSGFRRVQAVLREWSSRSRRSGPRSGCPGVSWPQRSAASALASLAPSTVSRTASTPSSCTKSPTTTVSPWLPIS